MGLLEVLPAGWVLAAPEDVPLACLAADGAVANALVERCE
jgi:hypothetical protein